MNTNKILIDYLTFTSKIDDKDSLISYLGLDKEDISFESRPGFYMYNDRLLFNEINILYNGRNEDMGVCCQMSGQGCRAFESFGTGDFNSIFADVKYHSGEKKEMNITRLDLAYDDFDGVLDIKQICDSVRRRDYVSPFHFWQTEEGSQGASCYIGAPSSNFRIRFYDKAMERKYKDGRHWIRCEIQLRNELAMSIACSDVNSIGERFVMALNNYIRFIEPGDDTNLQRRKTAAWWLNFVEHLKKIRLYETPGVEYNEISLENYVFRQAGNSIFTYIECFGIDKFMENLKKRGTQLNPNQLRLIAKYKEGVD